MATAQKRWTVGNAVGGVLLLLVAIPAAKFSVASAALFVLAGAIVLPPSRELLLDKRGIRLTKIPKALLIIALILFASMLSDQANKKLIAEEAEAARNAVIQDYTSRRPEHLAAIGDLVDRGQLAQAQEYIAKYTIYIEDPDLENLSTQVATQGLLAQIKLMSEDQPKEQLAVYEKLLTLHPDDTAYADQIRHWTAVVDAAAAEEKRRKTIEEQFSAWDGSHRGVERMIKDNMNDPDSYEHVKTVYWDMKDHLVVLTTFRGKNQFGGVVLNAVKAKVDLSGNVLKVLETRP